MQTTKQSHDPVVCTTSKTYKYCKELSVSTFPKQQTRPIPYELPPQRDTLSYRPLPNDSPTSLDFRFSPNTIHPIIVYQDIPLQHQDNMMSKFLDRIQVVVLFIWMAILIINHQPDDSEQKQTPDKGR